jgi:hypothetical protein
MFALLSGVVMVLPAAMRRCPLYIDVDQGENRGWLVAARQTTSQFGQHKGSNRKLAEAAGFWLGKASLVSSRSCFSSK